MAVRDRNLFAWQAYVITMAFLSVGLLLGMFFLWRGYSDLDKRFKDQKSSLDNATQEFRTSERRVDRLLSMMGYGQYTDADLQQMAADFANDERLGEVEADYAEQMKLFPPNQPANEKNLIKLPKFLIDTIRIRNEQIDTARERAAQLQTELAATIDRETKAREAAVAAQKAAEADLAQARQQHAANIAKLNQEKEEEIQKFQANLAVKEKALTEVRAENSSLVAENARQSETIQTQMDIINQYREPDFAAPQGEVVRVANGGTVVWINLGSEDGLREGVPFSLIDESEINVSNASPKAKLVVTRIVAPHLSIGEVTERRDYRSPIIPGDKVYSPAWRKGRKVGFALVGLLDMNDDGNDDSAQVQELIRTSGGVIDEVMDTSGSRSGPGMTPNTSFLVLGSDLNLPENASPELRAQQQARMTTYAKFIAEARQNGIMQISIDKLMGYLKTEGADRTIPLGNRLSGDDFPIKEQPNPPVSQGKVSDIYTPRKP
ncbi:MAG: hypothetical protein NXI32_09940 [bacterium]|nr:hypothetical protein [bacterium]